MLIIMFQCMLVFFCVLGIYLTLMFGVYQIIKLWYKR